MVRQTLLKKKKKKKKLEEIIPSKEFSHLLNKYLLGNFAVLQNDGIKERTGSFKKENQCVSMQIQKRCFD